MSPIAVARKPKGPTARARAARRRKDATVAARIRELVYARDGFCRYGLDVPAAQRTTWCWGYGEWAHFGDTRRSKTRGMAPEARHTTAGSLMLCTWHHRLYDARRLQITALGEDGCDGKLRFFEISERDAQLERIDRGDCD